jgi:hypothetical protein
MATEELLNLTKVELLKNRTEVNTLRIAELLEREQGFHDDRLRSFEDIKRLKTFLRLIAPTSQKNLFDKSLIVKEIAQISERNQNLKHSPLYLEGFSDIQKAAIQKCVDFVNETRVDNLVLADYAEFINSVQDATQDISRSHALELEEIEQLEITSAKADLDSKIEIALQCYEFLDVLEEEIEIQKMRGVDFNATETANYDSDLEELSEIVSVLGQGYFSEETIEMSTPELHKSISSLLSTQRRFY